MINTIIGITALFAAPCMCTYFGIKNNCFFTTLMGFIGIGAVSYGFLRMWGVIS